MGVSFVAHAQEVGRNGLPADGNVLETTPTSGKKPLPFAGSELTYGPSASIYTFDQSAELHYNPTVGHRLGLLPEWHFNDLFFARGKLWLSQELTQSDSTTYKNEVELSDLWLDFGYAGWTEKVTGLKLSAEVRATLPTSKASQSINRIMTVGPMLSVSRKFNLLHGLTVGYSGRFTYRFNQYTTGQYSSVPIANMATGCNGPSDPACSGLTTNGVRSTNYDITHGLAVSFEPIEKLSFDALIWYQHAFLYPLAPVPAQYQGAQGLAQTGPDVRNLAIFYLSASYQITKIIGLTLGAFTFTGEPDVNGRYINPFFNRYTSLYLEAGLDVEAVVSRFL